MDPAAKAAIQDYPESQSYTRWGFGASLGTHILLILIVAILAWLNHIKSLRDFMAASMNSPPPPTEVEVILEPDETPPPPTDHPLFIKQILQVPKPIVIPKPKPKPVPKPPHPIVQHHTESHSTSKAESQLVVGSGSFPYPEYPFAARQRRMQGTVLIRIVFDASGAASSATVVSSTGYSILDGAARSTILDSWKNASFAGQTQTVPIVFDLSKAQ